MLSDQTSSCFHQVHGVLVFECTVRFPPHPTHFFCLFVCWFESSSWRTTPPIFSSPFCTKKKWSSDFLNIPFFLCLVLSTFDPVQWHNLCFWVSTFLNDNRCFSYFSWFVFLLLSAVRLLIKTVYNLLRQPFFSGRLQCRARFCKGFAVLTPFWYMPVAVPVC